MVASNFGCDECFSLLYTLLDSMETWNLRKTKQQLYKDSLELFRNIYTINTFILYSAHIFVCMYIFMSIFSCLIVHVLLYNIFEIFGIFFIRNSFYPDL